jgi:hypothetical protein
MTQRKMTQRRITQRKPPMPRRLFEVGFAVMARLLLAVSR